MRRRQQERARLVLWHILTATAFVRLYLILICKDLLSGCKIGAAMRLFNVLVLSLYQSWALAFFFLNGRPFFLNVAYHRSRKC